jgi:hypothetical protein
MTQKVVTNDEEVTVSKKCFDIFSTFGRYVKNLRGTFVDNVKKSPKSTHPIKQYSIYCSVCVGGGGVCSEVY